MTAAATAFLAAVWYQRKAAVQRNQIRASVLDPCRDVFSSGRKIITETGLPRISGTYKGQEFDLQLVPDTLNMRKLPSLWLLVTLPAPMPVSATFDLMMRPRGIEMFSKFSELPIQMAASSSFPPDCAIRTDNPGGIPPEPMLRRHLGILQNQRVKELIISPKGLRIVWLAEEANRGRYLIFRDSEFGNRPVEPTELEPLLDYLLDLRDDLLTMKADRL